MKVLYTAAHGGFAGEGVPLGGGAAVFEMLRAEWERTRPFELVPITPSGVTGRDLVSYPEMRYAAFCRAFERDATEAVLRHDPAESVVLANDISEGPDFARLARAGFRIFTIFHVDVVAYVAEMYAHGWVAPERLVRWHRRWERFSPDVLQLVFQKQRDCVRHSVACVVPSEEMRGVIERCYGAEARVIVQPWGASPPTHQSTLRPCPDRLTLLTLSRISPEKNQELLLTALLDWERQGGVPPGLQLLLCGEAAFMRGQRYLERLRQLAARLRQVRVQFPGHVLGQQKADLFAAADLYVFPSRHESYGLTLMEALQAGLPALTLDHAGARAIMRPEFGEMTTPAQFLPALQRMLSDRARLRSMGEAARRFALGRPFSAAAHELSQHLLATRHPTGDGNTLRPPAVGPAAAPDRR